MKNILALLALTSANAQDDFFALEMFEDDNGFEELQNM